MCEYFALLREVYDKFNFDGHPERIYNIDEMGMPLDPHPPQSCCTKRPKEGQILMLWSEITNNRSRLCQCYHSCHTTVHHLCSQAAKSFVDER